MIRITETWKPNLAGYCIIERQNLMMDYIDYYQVLEVDKNADTQAIKKAYRRLARKYHPDLHPNDDQAKRKFQQINEAHTVLSDKEKRSKYDKYGKDWEHAEAFEEAARQRQHYQGAGRARAGSSTTYEDFGGQDFSDFFNSMFGRGDFGGSRESTRFRGQDFHATLTLDLRDVYRTQKQTLSLNGKNIRITIPAGVTDGQEIKIKGHGGPGVNGGPQGDLYIRFNITNLTPFSREGNDLHKKQDIDLFTAVLGGPVVIDTFDEKQVKLNIAAGTQNGAKMKLSGKGFPVYKKEGKFGDLILTLQVTIPTRLTDEEKGLFEKLAKINRK